MASARPTIQIEAVRTIGVPVTDQDQAIRFYVDTLGFEIRLDVPIGRGRRWSSSRRRRGPPVSRSWPPTSISPPGPRPGSG